MDLLAHQELVERISLVRRGVAPFRYRIKHWIGRRPALYSRIFEGRDGYENKLVTESTDLCIEGFPRSANSFAVGAFGRAQNQSHTIAHHNHVPAPILNAVDWGLPTVVLIRDPVRTSISGKALLLQDIVKSATDSPYLAIPYKTQLQEWINFYTTVWPVRDEIIVAPFRAVTDDFGDVIDEMNRAFGTTFERFNHTPENVEALRARGFHTLPSDQRERLKVQARERFERELGADHPLVREARTLYRRFLDYASIG